MMATMFPEPMVKTLPRERITLANTAVLVIDMERDFVDEGAVMQTPGGLWRSIGWRSGAKNP
jgi:hypothetical protein